MNRLILDYADSVEDAVALVEQYDLHDSTNCVFHYMVADSTGRSAILEWVGSDADHDSDGSQRRLNVLWNDTDSLSDSADWQVVTNFIKTPDYYTSPDQMHGLDRYEHLADRLRETNGIVADEDAAMALLAPEQRLILSLRVENDLSYTDIAAVLGVREGTVKSRLARARAQLRKKLSQSGNKAAAASSNPQKGGRGREL